MKISFQIQFHTVWGQTLYMIGSIPQLGCWDQNRAVPLTYTNDGVWTFEMELPEHPISFEYRYFLSSNGQPVFEEWQRNHQVEIKDFLRNYTLIDHWQKQPNDQAKYSAAFVKSWFAHPCDTFERIVKSRKKLTIHALAPEVMKHHSLAILGNQDEIGNWNKEQALIMSCDNFPEWSVTIDAAKISFPFEYKFCIIKDEEKAFVEWEDGENRTLKLQSVDENKTVIVSGLNYRKKNNEEWRFAGTVIPLFSLLSENSCGIGDFGDLKKMVDWLEKTSQKIVQLLPVNDTTATHTWRDSYPYNAISIYALHPLYLDIRQLGVLKDPEKQDFYEKKRQELNQLKEIDYEQVDQMKWSYFREIYEQNGEETFQSADFDLFFSENKDWLIPYAAFSHLRDEFGTPDFSQWKEHAIFDKEATEQFASPENPQYKKIALYFYLQYHLHKQLLDVKKYANARKIVLKGDIPIGINRLSVETWSEPQYFNMQYQTGAPPDDFALAGQNWRFPTYNWENIQKDNYIWWKKRFRKMADYFDAYRIDHILGFFRIWEIPQDSRQGILGWFSPSLPLSVEEIKNSGFGFPDDYTQKARIHERFLPEIFGEYTEEVTMIYLEKETDSHFSLKEEFDNQEKINRQLQNRNEKKYAYIRNGLFAICNEVLFIEDKQQKGCFHPRISGASSFAYRELDNADKYAFDLLYWDYFYQRNNHFWKDSGFDKLSRLISATDMLTCGEDLGMIPSTVPEVMDKLQILSLEVERMPKKNQVEFTDLKHLPYLSVCTTSTHDMPPLRLWWKENPGRTQRYYNTVLKKTGNAPEKCPPEICREIVKNHLKSRSMLCIIPFQDWLSIEPELRRDKAIEEQINFPENPDHYWRYRKHISIEALMKAENLNRDISELIRQSGR